MTQTENIKAKVHQLILDNMPNISANDLSDDAELFALGLNSLNAVSLVLGLEEIFGFESEKSKCGGDVEKVRAIR